MLTISDLPVNEDALDELGLTTKDVIRFAAKVDCSGGPDACWLYRAGGNPNGYGAFWINRFQNNRGAHVISWMLFRGTIPDSKFVCHTCDNRRCVNPNHFFLGTTQDNMDDMKAKGRQMKGEANNHAKLTEIIVREIRALNPTCWNDYHAIGRSYGVEGQTIKAVVERRLWKHVQ